MLPYTATTVLAMPEICFTDLGWTYFNPDFSVLHISAQAYVVVNRYKVICHRIINGKNNVKNIGKNVFCFVLLQVLK